MAIAGTSFFLAANSYQHPFSLESVIWFFSPHIDFLWIFKWKYSVWKHWKEKVSKFIIPFTFHQVLVVEIPKFGLVSVLTMYTSEFFEEWLVFISVSHSNFGSSWNWVTHLSLCLWYVQIPPVFVWKLKMAK